LAKTGALDRKTDDRKNPRAFAAAPAKFRKVVASSSRAGSGVNKPEKERTYA
jgi:hypothetical protein